MYGYSFTIVFPRNSVPLFKMALALEDVIELGSSDDEAEPATKKIKPTPNAMVHIPTKLHDVTIKPAKLKTAIPKELAGKNVTVTKISKSANVLTNPYAIKNKLNGKQVSIKPVLPKQVQQKPITIKQLPSISQMTKKPQVINKTNINPSSLMKKINSQVVINKVPSTAKVMKNPIRIQSPRSINNLPSGITVTRTPGGQKRVAPVPAVSNPVRKKQKRNIPKTAVGEVLTVDLDDDELSSASTASPQWYLRPEEQRNPIEELNNKEPEPKSSKELIEITIEDSPAKPVKDKRICEVSTHQTVTIDDSPVKVTVEKNTASGSDCEANMEVKVPHSKKKLEYPKETEVISDTIEIEITPVTYEPLEEETVAQTKTNIENDVIEIEESPLKVQAQGSSTPKKNLPKTPLVIPDSIKEIQQVQATDDLSEFHPVYQSFIRLCFQLENSDDMKKIVEKKIKTYYRQVPKEYTESEEFTEMVSGKVLSMKASPEKMYLYIKDIVDELNLQRKMAKSQILFNIHEKKSSEGEKFLYGADSEYDSKRQRQIRKLEKTLKKLHRAIQKLEDQEVDFDDEEDSVYLLTESDEGSTSNKDSDKQLEKDSKTLLQRYKERMVRVHAKFCQLTNTKMPSEPRIQIDARPGQATGPAKRLEKWINKKVPIGTPLPFPDFHDVLRCVREANVEDKLGWNEADIMEEARDLFTRCGKKLQRRRQENEWRIAASRISVDVDPAEKDQKLLRELEENKKIAAKKETEVFNKYADRQSQLKLEAEEIGDKEAEESPADDDEEEEREKQDEKSLENKEKRKERLKRLLHDKSKKNAEASQKEEKSSEQKDDNSLQKEKSEEVKSKEVTDQLDTASKNKGNNEITEQKENESNEKVQCENQQKDVKSPTVCENKEVSENESVKTIDSDTVEIIPNDNDNIKNKQENKSISKNKEVKDKPMEIVERAHSISDDSSHNLESDVDELHLLQKLHSENEKNSSTLESSDSETPVAISDTLSSDNKKRPSSDVISIENSSYSESESNNVVSDIKATDDNDGGNCIKVIEEVVDVNMELECSDFGIEKKQARTNNDEYNESIEDILLASTDDEVEISKSSKPANDEHCVNLKDDNISIGDTVVEGVDKADNEKDKSTEKQDDACSVDSLTCVSLKDDSPANPNEDKDVQSVKESQTQNIEEINNIEKVNEEINSIDEYSENSVQSVNTIEVKESSSEKETEVVNECSNTQDSGNNENLVQEVIETVDESSQEEANQPVEEFLEQNSNDNAKEVISDKEINTVEAITEASNTAEELTVEEANDTAEEQSIEEIIGTVEELSAEEINDPVENRDQETNCEGKEVDKGSNTVAEVTTEKTENKVQETVNNFVDEKKKGDADQINDTMDESLKT